MNLSNPDLEGLKDRMIALGRGPIPDAKAIRGRDCKQSLSLSLDLKQQVAEDQGEATHRSRALLAFDNKDTLVSIKMNFLSRAARKLISPRRSILLSPPKRSSPLQSHLSYATLPTPNPSPRSGKVA
jgi:hypothetical protein